MKLVLGLVLAGISISAMPQSAKACWICDPVAATKATIRKPHRAVQAVTDPLVKVGKGVGKVIGSSSGSSSSGGGFSGAPAMGGQRPNFGDGGRGPDVVSQEPHEDTSDLTTDELIFGDDGELTNPEQTTGSLLTGRRPPYARRSSYGRFPSFMSKPSYMGRSSYMRKYSHTSKPSHVRTSYSTTQSYNFSRPRRYNRWIGHY